MPIFKRRKGNYEINQYGRVLSVREWMEGEDRLARYCMFDDAATASGEFERLLRAKAAEGFVPKDDAAKELATSLKLERPKKKAPPTLPFRQDASVYNEATGFAIASLKLAGKGMEDGDRKWNKAVNDGLLIPITLYQDDSFCIRVVAGDQLNPQETEEWVGRLEWRLNLAEGKLCISGGSEWLYAGYDRDDVYDDIFVRVVELPPGHYKATVYSYLSGVNGEACLDELAGGPAQAEPAAQWFRRTRPGERFPEWLAHWCVAYPDTDPGHEKEWQNTPLPDREKMPEFVDFLLHLEPAEPPAKPTKAENKGGWFSHTEGARKPKRCPSGIVASVEPGPAKRANGKWFYPREVLPLVEGFKLSPVAGGEVAVPLERLGDVLRLARFCHPHAHPELRASLAPGTALALDGKWPDNFLAVKVNDVLRFEVEQDINAARFFEAGVERMKTLPDGAAVELATTVFGHSSSKTDRPIATHRYRGTVRGGVWRIDQTYPQVNAETLRAALALSAEARARNGFKLCSDEEAVKIQEWCKANLGSMISDNPPVHEGEFIRLKEPKAWDYNQVGGAVFAVRYASVWPVFELSAQPARPPRPKPVAPTRGECVLEGAGSRMYFLSDARPLGPAVQESIDKIEKELIPLGFRFAADIVCNLFGGVVVRGYAASEGDTWASILCTSPSVAKLELSTRFQKEGASLLTCGGLTQKDDPAKRSFRQIVQFTTIEELLAKHRARQAELAAQYGPPITIDPTGRSLAESIEAALAKQFGG